MKITFLGGVGTVTGSKYLLEVPGRRVMIDCGLFQGFKQLRLRNWAKLPIDPASVDAVVLTHAHLDHSGYLPRFVKNGFTGTVHSTPGTRDLCRILLLDSAYLQEQDAYFANRYNHTKHKPALPLYTKLDAETAINRFSDAGFGDAVDLGGGLTLRFYPAGHILGASILQISDGTRTIVFSGDLGRLNDPTMVDPAIIETADYLVVESTYGNRRHDPEDPEDILADLIVETAKSGGAVLIPSFAVGRTQSILFHLHRLKVAHRIPDLPIFIDSPMAINASDVFCKHVGTHRLNAEECRAICNTATYVREAEESKRLDDNHVPMVLISASGMATGGRIVHHLKHFAPDHRNTILFAGFQAGGTRGAAMTAGAEHVKIHGQLIPVRARVENLHMLSAHADSVEIVDWLRNFKAPPKLTFITHGEPAASDAMRIKIEEALGWQCQVPDYKDAFDLD